MIDRRAFIGTLTGGLLVASRAAEAQQTGKICRIGSLGTGIPERLRQSLREVGYVEGLNVADCPPCTA